MIKGNLSSSEAMEAGEVVSTGAAVGQEAPCPPGAHSDSSVPPAKLTVVIEVVSGQESGKGVEGADCRLSSMHETLGLIQVRINLPKKR